MVKVIYSSTLQTSDGDKIRFIPQIFVQKLSGIRLSEQILPSEIIPFIQKIVTGKREEMTIHLSF